MYRTSLGRGFVQLRPDVVNHFFSCWPEVFISYLQILHNIFSKPATLPVLLRLRSVDQDGFDVVQDLCMRGVLSVGFVCQFVVLLDPTNAKPRELVPSTGKGVSRVLL